MEEYLSWDSKGELEFAKKKKGGERAFQEGLKHRLKALGSRRAWSGRRPKRRPL